MRRPNGEFATETIVEARRRRVAALRLRGLTIWEIVHALADPERGLTNPKTGGPYTKSTIARDIDALKARWREEALADIGEHLTGQLAELREARRQAWARGDMSEVRQNIALEMRLLGTAAPDKVESSGETVLRVVYGDDGTDGTAA